MTSLRTQWGLNLDALSPSSVLALKESLQHIDPAYYRLHNNILKLTEEGKLFADGIAAELFVEEST